MFKKMHAAVDWLEEGWNRFTQFVRKTDWTEVALIVALIIIAVTAAATLLPPLH